MKKFLIKSDCTFGNLSFGLFCFRRLRDERKNLNIYHKECVNFPNDAGQMIIGISSDVFASLTKNSSLDFLTISQKCNKDCNFAQVSYFSHEIVIIPIIHFYSRSHTVRGKHNRSKLEVTAIIQIVVCARLLLNLTHCRDSFFPADRNVFCGLY